MRKSIFRIVALILVFVLLLALAGCAGGGTTDPKQDDSDKPAQPTEKTAVSTSIYETNVENRYFVGDSVTVEKAKLSYATGYIESQKAEVTYPDGHVSSDPTVHFDTVGTYRVTFSAELYREILTTVVDVRVDEWQDSDAILAVKDIACADTHFLGNSFCAPETATVDYFGREVVGTFESITFPSGAVSYERTNALSERGNYELSYLYEKDGREFHAKKTVGTDGIRFTIDGERTTASYHYDSIDLSLAKNEEFRVNQIVDLRKFTSRDALISFTLDPERVADGLPDAMKINIKLTDVYDPTNYVIIQVNKRWDQAYYRSWSDPLSYIYAGGAKQTLAGIQHGTTNTVAGFESIFSMVGAPAGQVMELGMDYAERQVFCFCTAGYGTLVADLDDPANYLGDGEISDVLFEGFTTGECYLSIYAEDYYSSDKLLRMHITNLCGFDLTDLEKVEVDGKESVGAEAGSTVDLTQDKLSVNGNLYPATPVCVISPSGQKITGNSLVLTEGGTYRVFLSATASGKTVYGSYEIRAAKNEIIVSSPLLNGYKTGTSLTVPAASLSYFGELSDASHTVILPGGGETSDATVVLTDEGTYTLRYYAEKGGKSFEKTVTFSVSSAVAYANGKQAETTSTEGKVPGAWDSGLLKLHVESGDTATFNELIDFTDKSSFFLFQVWFTEMTDIGYANAFPVVFTLTNSENINEYLQITLETRKQVGGNEADGFFDYYQVAVSVRYCDGEKFTYFANSYLGSNCALTGPYDIKGVTISLDDVAEGTKLQIKSLSTVTDLIFPEMNFSTGVLTVSAAEDVDLIFSYVGDLRDWAIVGSECLIP